MDHAATARINLGARVSQAKEPSDTPVSGLPVFREITDEVLFERLARGSQEALALLFRRYAGQVRNIGRRILRDGGEADDLVQEVFLYVFRKGMLYDPAKGSARSWLIQVAYTQAFLRRRELSSHGLYASAGTADPNVSGSPVVAEVRYENTVEAFFGKNGWKRVWDSLTGVQRETFRLHFYEGCTFNEIAETLGQSYVNIRHHYYRGLEKLRKHAEDNGLRWP